MYTSGVHRKLLGFIQIITGVIAGFLPREQWEEYSLDSVSVITNDELE